MRRRERVVADDGGADGLDLRDCGDELAPDAWHAALGGDFGGGGGGGDGKAEPLAELAKSRPRYAAWRARKKKAQTRQMVAQKLAAGMAGCAEVAYGNAGVMLINIDAMRRIVKESLTLGELEGFIPVKKESDEDELASKGKKPKAAKEAEAEA